jgi:MFS family permease
VLQPTPAKNAAEPDCIRHSNAQFFFWLGVAGVFFGLSTPMIFAIGATLAGPRAAGRWAGAQNLAGQLAGILAPVVTGFIVDRTGAFSWAFAVAAVSAVLAMVAWGVVIRRVATVQWPDGLAPVPFTPSVGASRR